METPDEMMARLEQEQCWYPMAICNRKANDHIMEHGKEIGYCQAHAAEMQKRYVEETR